MKCISLTAVFGLSLVSGAATGPHYKYIRAGNGTGVDAPAAAAPAAAAPIAAGCATGVHMIICRASTENPGPGVIGGVATMIQKAIPGSDSESVTYPATLQNYPSSEGKGVAAMTKLVQAYAQKCPNSKVVMMGYSQGAQVVGDVLAGTSSAGQDPTPPISKEMTKNLIAVVQMGDPTHVPNMKYNVGTATKPGMFPRKDTKALEPYADITQAYCNSGDTFCDSGNSIATHLAYVQTNGAAASAFVVKMYQQSTGGAAPAAAAAA